MNEIRDEGTIAAPPAAVWELIHDPAAIPRLLPSAESVRSTEPGRFSAVLVARTLLMTVRADVEATYLDEVAPSHLRLELSGRARGFEGAFRASIPIDLAPVAAGTRITSVVELTVSGALAAFGAGALRDPLRAQIAELLRNVEADLRARGATPA